MQYATRQYKEIMSRHMRNRGYVSVSVGIINNEAQGSAKFSTDYSYAYWSNLTRPLTNKPVEAVYATMEENFFKADGSMFFMPEDNEYAQFLNVGLTTEDILGTVEVTFDRIYEIKGLTINFGDNFPTEFTIVSDEYSRDYSISDEYFYTTDLFGATSYIRIIPSVMSGGNQRMRINSMLMGVGLCYGNDDVSSLNASEDVSGIAESIPSYSFNLTILDPNNHYNVDNDDSFANFLHTEQNIEASVGLELDNGEIEWIRLGTWKLTGWKVQKGKMSFSAKDFFTFMDGTYYGGNYIGEKNLYDTAESILLDAGLDHDQFYLDEYLRDVTITAPIPETKHKECLQLIANAARCKLYQGVDGKIHIRANFESVIEPEDIIVITDDYAPYSKPENMLLASDCVYATMEENFFKADGSMFFMPEDSSDYLETSYVSEAISDENGLFEENPKFVLELPASYSYFGVSISFYGNPPKKLRITTYKYEQKQDSVEFDNVSRERTFLYEFLDFNRMEFEFLQTYPHNRIEVNRVTFGDVSDYVMRRDDMYQNPIGYRNETIKNVGVRVFSYENDEEGRPQQVNDNVWVNNEINTFGIVAQFENPLITTEEHALEVNEWIADHLKNNVEYDIKFRGEPRINATDIIFMEQDTNRILQCEVEKNTFTFNGAFGGSATLRRAKKGS